MSLHSLLEELQGHLTELSQLSLFPGADSGPDSTPGTEPPLAWKSLFRPKWLHTKFFDDEKDGYEEKTLDFDPPFLTNIGALDIELRTLGEAVREAKKSEGSLPEALGRLEDYIEAVREMFSFRSVEDAIDLLVDASQEKRSAVSSSAFAREVATNWPVPVGLRQKISYDTYRKEVTTFAQALHDLPSDITAWTDDYDIYVSDQTGPISSFTNLMRKFNARPKGGSSGSNPYDTGPKARKRAGRKKS